MMSNQIKSKIMERLANDPTLEMNYDDLEQLLEAELAKPADEIDAVLVDEILDAMNAPEPDPEQMRRSWHAVKASLPRQAKAHVPQAIVRFGAVAAAVIMIMFVTLREAEAFRWTLIEKILKPVAETFGIVITNQEDITPEETESTLYSIEDAPSTFIEYASLEEIPETAHGYLIRPKWIPEDFKLSGASLYSTTGIDIYSLDFVNNDRTFNLYIHIYTDEDTVYSYEFERTLDIPIEKAIGQHIVTFYTNADDEHQSTLWIYENAHYRLFGELTINEIEKFISLME